MRELMRSIARSRMKDNGIRHINKKLNQIGKDGKPTGKKVSFFSQYWRMFTSQPKNDRA